MPEVLTRLANPWQVLEREVRRGPVSEARQGQITALIQRLSDTGADPLIQPAPVCLLQPGCQQALNTQHTRTRQGADTSCWPQLRRRPAPVCLHERRHAFMHAQMVHVRIARAQRNAPSKSSRKSKASADIDASPSSGSGLN